MQIVQLFRDYESLVGKEVQVDGWVKTCRDQKKMVFVHLTDGTNQQTLQIVASPEHVTNMDELASITTGTSLHVEGVVVLSPAKGQKFELSARKVQIYQVCPTDFPFQKVGLPLEFMRKFPHLRHRSNIMQAVFAVKSRIMFSIHQFFMERSYHQVDLPILTTNACESGCQPLQVTSLMNDGKVSSIPVKTVKREVDITDPVMQLTVGGKTMTKDIPTDEIDFSKDFFDNPVFLTVSNQLHLECFAHGLGYVYTITPATRGEPSQTTKHLATFQMLEWEFCFGKLSDNMEIAESLIKYCAKQILEKCPDEMAVLEKNEAGLEAKVKKIMADPFVRISHYDAVKLLKEANATTAFADEPDFAGDLAGEHERWLVNHFGQPVIVMRYPKAVKAFYMPVADTKEVDGKVVDYVDCFDLLMDIGEVVGGSQRIWDEATLVQRMADIGMDPKHLDWYVELRRYGSVPHGGAGIGIERLTATLTGMANIKDCISFPITVHSCTH